jgi:WhiB family redox-sensing transcriptional regulator
VTVAQPAPPASTAQAWRETLARESRQPGSWVLRARCRGVQPTIFFPDSDDAAQAALELCSQCPVREACLEYALETKEVLGVWGGTTELERRRMRRRARRRRRRTA